MVKLSKSSSEILKWSAIILMIVDHLGLFIFQNNEIMRDVGRLAYPLFAILLIYNYVYRTSNKEKMIQRLGIFALISQPFFMIFIDYHLNIYFQFFFGLSFIYLIEKMFERENFVSTFINDDFNKILIMFPILIFFIYELINLVDYGLVGFALLISIYLVTISWIYLPLLVSSLYLLNPENIQGLIGISSLLIVLLVSYIPEFKFNRVNKWFFYLFYPIQFPIYYLILKTI